MPTEVIMNSIFAIHPYKSQGLWVFDDERVGLIQEPFVAGADVIIEQLVSNIPRAEEGFTLLFSASPFSRVIKQTMSGVERKWAAIGL
jgi:hypothetical protein